MMDAYMELTRMFQDQLKKNYDLRKVVVNATRELYRLERTIKKKNLSRDEVRELVLNLADHLYDQLDEVR